MIPTIPNLPPFPDGVPTAQLKKLSLFKLLERDPSESEHLWQSGKDLGFFNLDLKCVEGNLGDGLLKDVDDLFRISDDFFDLSLNQKLKYDFYNEGSYCGYKGYGASVIDNIGSRDRVEIYNISKDDIMAVSPPLPAPSVITANRTLFKRYIQSCHTIAMLLLEHLNYSLQLPENTLANLHRLNVKSGDQIRFIRAPPQPPSDRRASIGAHTDFGSITILFNRIGGLQIPSSRSKEGMEWEYVRPLPGHCLVNLGDAMVKLTNGILKSSIHRVVSPPGEQESATRTSLVYLARPEDEVLLKPVQGSALIDAVEVETTETMTSKVWISKRATRSEKTSGTEVGRWEEI